MARGIGTGRRVCFAVGALALLAVAVRVPHGVAQTALQAPGTLPPGARPDPSPFAPGDLKKPEFDTATPVYHLGNAQAKSASTTVAEVEGHAITLGDVADAIAALPPNVKAAPFDGLFPGILSQLVQEEALVIGAQRAGLDEKPDVKRRIKAAGDHVLAQEYLEREVGDKITEQALLDRYNRDIAGKPGPEEVHVRVILARTEQEGSGIIAQLRNGADFAVLAKQMSRDTTASNGGDLGFLTRSGLNAEVGAVAFSTPPGAVAPYPVLTTSGWFVVKVEERRRAPTLGFFEVREQLRRALLREDGVLFVQRSLDLVTVRQYDISGKEAAVGTISK